MGKRHESIGIKQVIRLEWMQKATNLLLAGFDTKAIRQELHEFLADKKGDGSNGQRSAQTRNFVVNNLMNIWISPAPELIPFRNASLVFIQDNPSMALPIHWGLISAAYPFWFNVARQTGRLLALQDQVTHAQIIKRLKEQYGDRQTVSRYAQYVIRSFVAWGVLKDSSTKGCYEKSSTISIINANLAILMFESALWANSESKIAMGMALVNPAFFPFQLPIITGDYVSQHSEGIDVDRYGVEDVMMRLKYFNI